MVDKPIKFQCPKCKHIQWKTWKEVAIQGFVTIVFTLGLVFLIQIFVMGPVYWMNSLSSGLNTYDARQHADELRNETLHYTTYDGYDSFKFARDLALNLPRIRYVGDSMYSTPRQTPEETLEQGGDCKSSSALFVAMMHSVGYNAFVDCNYAAKHCVARIPYEGTEDREQYMIVDLTTDLLYIMPNEADHWKRSDQHIFAERLRKSWIYSCEEPEFDEVYASLCERKV
jgi:hypothetical protein